MRVLKFATMALLLAIVPVAAIQAGYYFKLKSSMATRELSTLGLVADMQKERIETFVLSNLSRLDQVTSRRVFRELLRDYLPKRDKGIQYQLNRSLLDARYAIPSFETVSVADLQGRIISSTDNGLIGTDVAQDPMFIQGRKDNSISLSFPGMDEVDDDEPCLLLSGPLVVEDEVVAVALVRSGPIELLNLLRGPKNVSGGYWELVQRLDTDTVAIVAPESAGNSLYKRIASDDEQEEAMEVLRGTELTTFERNSAGPRIRVTRFVPKVGWALRMSRDAAPVQADLDSLRNVIILIGLFLTAATIGIALYFSHVLVRVETMRRGRGE